MGVVLVNLDRERCIRSFKELGLSDIDKMTGTAMHNGIFRDFEKGVLTVSDFYDSVRSLAAQPIANELIYQAWTSMLKDIPSNKLERILQLRSSYRVFLLSNTNELHWNYCAENMFKYKNYEWSDFFEKRWLSYELHMLKPDPEIFKFVLQDANLLPEQTLFVDDAQANCDAAQSLGIQTYQPQCYEDWTSLFV